MRSSWEWEDARCKLKMCYQKAIINCNHATQPIIIINLVPLLLLAATVAFISPPPRAAVSSPAPMPAPWISWRVPGVVCCWRVSPLLGLHCSGTDQRSNKWRPVESKRETHAKWRRGAGSSSPAEHASASLELCLCFATENVYSSSVRVNVINASELDQQDWGGRPPPFRLGFVDLTQSTVGAHISEEAIFSTIPRVEHIELETPKDVKD